MKILKQKINNKKFVGYFSKPLKNVWKKETKYSFIKDQIMDLEKEEMLKDEAINRKYRILSDTD